MPFYRSFFCSALVAGALAGHGAMAEEYLDCKLTGQSDAPSSAPTRVSLDEAGQWHLSENGKNIPGIRVSRKQSGIVVTYSSVESGTVIESSYSFDDRRCDSEEVGSATLKRQAVGASDSAAGSRVVTSVYECTCAVD